MKPTLFLDIDGVIMRPISVKDLLHPKPKDKDIAKKLAEKYHDERFLEFDSETLNQFNNYFDRASLAMIKNLCTLYDLDIIIISSWAMFYSLEDFKTIFLPFGLSPFIQGEISSNLPKKDFIQNYIQEHNIKDYLIIDDLNMKDIFNERQIVPHSGSFNTEDYLEAERLCKSLCIKPTSS